MTDADPREEWRQAKWIAIYASTLSLAAQDERKAKKRWLTTVEMWILRAGAAAFADEATSGDKPVEREKNCTCGTPRPDEHERSCFHSSGINSASNST